MTELSVSAIGHHLDFVVRMKGPNRTRGKGIVIEDAQGTKVHISWIMVLVEGEMPATKERTILD
jgi:succinyl-CoA synthetase beta subunit